MHDERGGSLINLLYAMRRRLDLKYFSVGLLLAAVVGLLLSTFTELSFLAAFIIILVAMVLNGLVAAFEDNLPGGFNNPMALEEKEIELKKRKKKYLPARITVWAIFVALLLWMLLMYVSNGI